MHQGSILWFLEFAHLISQNLQLVLEPVILSRQFVKQALISSFLHVHSPLHVCNCSQALFLTHSRRSQFDFDLSNLHDQRIYLFLSFDFCHARLVPLFLERILGI